MRAAVVLAVRVKDWLTTGKKLPPWKTSLSICFFCKEQVIVTPDYATTVELLGFDVRYICTRCFVEQQVAS